jgi:hypothetical protein
LKMISSHDSLFLLRNVLTAPRLMYLLRSAPCTVSPVLPLYDDVIRDSLSTNLNVEIVGERWHQASLPVRWGRSGRPWCCYDGTFCPLGLVTSTTELTVSLLPARLRDTLDSEIVPATSAWLRMTHPPTNIVTALTPTSAAHRSWNDSCCKAQAGMLLDSTVDHVDCARVLASRSPGSGDLLEALPLSKMYNITVRIASGLRLGAPIVRAHVCVCGKTVAVDGHHGLSCRFGFGHHSHNHNQVNDVLCRAFIKSGTLATCEPHSLCYDRTTGWTDSRSLVTWSLLGLGCHLPEFTESHVQASCTHAGSAAEAFKQLKYAYITTDVEFIPEAIETSGTWACKPLTLSRRSAGVLHMLRKNQGQLRSSTVCVMGTFGSTESNIITFH